MSMVQEPRWVEYDRVKGAFVSPALGRPLPNKVASWMAQKPLASLCKTQHQAHKALTYRSLRELCTGVLVVNYGEHGMVEYIRSWGRLGCERRIQDPDIAKAVPLSYHEKKKSLISALFPGQEVPNKVTDWLKGKLLNLADLHGARPKCQHLPEVKLDMSEDESQISWFCPLRKAVYMVKGMSSDVGVVYASSCNGGDKWVELVYMYVSETECEWRILEPEGEENSVPLPFRVSAWLAAHSKRVQAEGTKLSLDTVQAWAECHTQAPWMKAPSYFTLLLPPALQGHLAILQSNLQHSFRNPMLLAAALTHPSKNLPQQSWLGAGLWALGTYRLGSSGALGVQVVMRVNHGPCLGSGGRALARCPEARGPVMAGEKAGGLQSPRIRKDCSEAGARQGFPA